MNRISHCDPNDPVTTVLFGLLYPLLSPVSGSSSSPHRPTADDRTRRPDRGFHSSGQPFSSAGYFRPASAAGSGYDSTSSGGSISAHESSTDGPHQNLTWRAASENRCAIPVGSCTASGSGLDPDISPAAAEFRFPGSPRERGMGEAEVRALVAKHTLVAVP